MESTTPLIETAASFHGRKQTYHLIIHRLLQVLKEVTADFHWLKCCSLSQVNESHVPKQSTTVGSKTFLLNEPRRKSLRTLRPLPLLLSQVKPEPNCSPLHGYGLPQHWAGPNHRTKRMQWGLLTPLSEILLPVFCLGYCPPWLPRYADGTGTYHSFYTIMSSLQALMEDFMLITCNKQNSKLS